MNIESIIRQRLSLQSTKNLLDSQFSIPATLEYILSANFTSKFQSWDSVTQNRFIVALGGKANFNKTKRLLLEKR